MEKLSMLMRIKELYNNNNNIIQYLRSISNSDTNNVEDIMISYDFQAGTYIKDYKNNPNLKNDYSKCIASTISSLGKFDSLLEAGVGEATTLGNVLRNMVDKIENIYGFDISWSRIGYANRFLNELNIDKHELFVGDLFNIPIKDNSIDVVYTSHSIEPNGGREKEALKELYRITNKYLILLEPAFEFANEEARKRMIYHGYATNLYLSIKELGYKIIEHRLFDVSANNLNPTGLIIIEKDLKDCIKHKNPICCPITKTNLIFKNGVYYSKDSLLMYPIINNIPCLLPQNAIIATKFLQLECE